jgi:hypothetical protein
MNQGNGFLWICMTKAVVTMPCLGGLVLEPVTSAQWRLDDKVTSNEYVPNNAGSMADSTT